MTLGVLAPSGGLRHGEEEKGSADNRHKTHSGHSQKQAEHGVCVCVAAGYFDLGRND